MSSVEVNNLLCLSASN